MIGKAELTQALALTVGTAMGSMGRVRTPEPYWHYPYKIRRGKYGRNLNRTCKLLRRLKTTC